MPRPKPQLVLAPLLLAGIAVQCAPPPATAESEVDLDGAAVDAAPEPIELALEDGVGRLVTLLPETPRERPLRGALLVPSASFAAGPAWNSGARSPSFAEALLDQGRAVFLLDFPGYGACEDPVEPATFGAERAAEYVVAAIERIRVDHGIERIDLLGWSWGAQVAGVTAMRGPEGLGRVVLYGFNPSLRYPADILPNGPLRPLERSSVDSDFVDGHYDAAIRDAFAEAVLAADTSTPSGAIRDFVEHLPLVDPEAIDVPVLVLSGQFEVELPPGGPEEWRPFFAERAEDLEAFARAGGFESIVVPGGGHAAHMDDASDAWRTAVLEFLGS